MGLIIYFIIHIWTASAQPYTNSFASFGYDFGGSGQDDTAVWPAYETRVS